jgi:hypothetical protein
MAITITAVTAVIGVTVDIDEAEALRLVKCSPALPPGGAVEPVRIFLEELAREPDVPLPSALPAATGAVPSRQRDTRKKQIDRAWLLREYVDHGRSTVEIGREIGCSSSTVSKYLREYGIPSRPRPDGLNRRPTAAPSIAQSHGRGASAGSSTS